MIKLNNILNSIAHISKDDKIKQHIKLYIIYQKMIKLNNILNYIAHISKDDKIKQHIKLYSSYIKR